MMRHPEMIGEFFLTYHNIQKKLLKLNGRCTSERIDWFMA
eukprot:UN09013